MATDVYHTKEVTELLSAANYLKHLIYFHICAYYFIFIPNFLFALISMLYYLSTSESEKLISEKHF